MEFMGYVRPDGKVGARNYVAVIPSVTCANDVANAICHQVQGTITYLHHQGCCQMPRLISVSVTRSRSGGIWQQP